MSFLERPGCVRPGGARGDERLCLAPATVRRERRAFEPFPRHRGFRPQLGRSVAEGTLILGLGQGEPAGGVRRNRRRLGGGVTGGDDQLARPIEPAVEGIAVPAGACEGRQLRLCAQSLGAEPDTELGGLTGARSCETGADALVSLGPAALPREPARRRRCRRSPVPGLHAAWRGRRRGAPDRARSRRGRSRCRPDS